MKTSVTLPQPARQEFALVVFAALLALGLLVSFNTDAQSRKAKRSLSNVTFNDEYVRKANEKATESEIIENLGTLTVPVVEKKVNYMKQLPDGRYLFVRAMENPAVGDYVCLTKTDADGNVQWESKYIGDGFSSEPDNFIKHTRDGGYLVQRTVCNSENAPVLDALTQNSASK